MIALDRCSLYKTIGEMVDGVVLARIVCRMCSAKGPVPLIGRPVEVKHDPRCDLFKAPPAGPKWN